MLFSFFYMWLKNVKSHVFWIFKKKREKNVFSNYVRDEISVLGLDVSASGKSGKVSPQSRALKSRLQAIVKKAEFLLITKLQLGSNSIHFCSFEAKLASWWDKLVFLECEVQWTCETDSKPVWVWHLIWPNDW